MDVGPAGRMTTLLWDARFSLLTALLAGFGRAAAEVGAVMIVGGNIDGFTRTMTTAVALETSKGNLPLAMGLGLILVAIVLAINAAAWGTRVVVRAAGGLTMRAPSSDLPLVLDDVSLQAGATTILDRLSLTIDAGRADADRRARMARARRTLAAALHGAMRAVDAAASAGAAGPISALARRAILFQRPVMLRRTAAANVAYALAQAGTPRSMRARASARCWTASGSPIWRSGRRGGFRAANSSGWRWRGRWRAIRRSCCSTSPPPISIPPRRAASRRSC